MGFGFRFSALLFLIFGFAGPAWGRQAPQVEEVSLGNIVWNTNVVKITAHNPAPQPKTIVVDVQAKNHRGTGWQTERTLAAGDRVTFDRDFIMPPFPGPASVTIRISEKSGAEIYSKQFHTEFAMENRSIGNLHLPQWWIDSSPYKDSPLAADYPALEMASSGHFVYYFPQNFAYVRSHVKELMAAREMTYGHLCAMLNPGFDERVAVYLFPDEPTKFAYTGHMGQGWAFDHVLVEVFDPLHPDDPHRIDPNHELVHIITGPLGDPPTMFNEGLAVYLQVGHRWEDLPLDDWARSFDDAKMLTPIARIFALEDFGSKGTRGWVVYPEAGSMVQFLVSHYGLDKVMQAFRELKSGAPESDNAAVFERTFGISVDTFAQDWLNSLKQGSGRVPTALIDDIRVKIAEDEK